jgi:PTH1 family peptidyl-tRNA hydrolase
VVHDELDLLPGTVRLKQGGGNGGHNGLRSVTESLGSGDFVRLRIGIGHPGHRDLVTDYVLTKPSQEDRRAIEGAIADAMTVLPEILGGRLERAMHELHTEKQSKE